MGETQKRKGGGAKLSRTQTVTVRLDPQLRYMAELAARMQRRTLSSFIEWAIEESLGQVPIDNQAGGPSVKEEIQRLWDVDEADRFIKLAIAHPHLLTHDEQVLWKLIKESRGLWFDALASHDDYEDYSNYKRVSQFRFDELRKHWQAFQEVANGEADPGSLPKWDQRGNEIRDTPEDLDGDIPF
jgi:hypothetical protein